MKLLKLLIGISLFALGCKSASGPVTEPSISFSFHNMPQSRAGEVYVVWAEVPPGSIAPSHSMPLHGLNKTKFFAKFTVDRNGNIHGLDTLKTSTNIGTAYNLISRVEISIEREDIGASDTIPSALFLTGDVTGSANTGTATLVSDDGEALGAKLSDLRKITGWATMATSAKTPVRYIGEVYLMRATSATDTSAGLSSLAFLGAIPTSTWRYGVWTIDSAFSPPVFTFLGYVNSPGSKDTKSAHDNFPYPGGRSPSDTATTTILDLTTGKSGVLLNLEPDVLAGDPPAPFAASILWTIIPAGTLEFSPFPLENIAGGFPTVDVKISR